MKSQAVIKDQFRLIVAKDIARTATVGALASPTSVADGEVVVTDEGNVILDTTTVLSATRIKVVQGRGATTPLFETATLTLDEVYQYAAQAYEAPVQQVTYVGYDAVIGVGSFEVINNTSYQMTTTFLELTVPGLQGSYQPLSAWYNSDGSATQAKICNGLYSPLIKQLARFPYPVILAERVNEETAARVAAGTAGTLSFTQGSKTVTISGGVWAGSTIAGAYLCLSAADTAPIYKIAAIVSTTELVLDEPFQAADTTAAFNVAQALPAASVGDFGIKMTGIEQPFVLDSRPVDKVQFFVGVSNALGVQGNTPVVTEVQSTYGHGTYALVTTQQADSSRNAGDFYGYSIYPYRQPMLTTVSGQDYSTLNVGTKAQRGGNGNLTPNNFVANIEIACALDGNVANTFDTNIIGPSGVASVIDAFVTQNPAFNSQLGNL